MNFRGGYKYLNPFIDEGSLGITDSSMYMIVEEQRFHIKFFKI